MSIQLFAYIMRTYKSMQDTLDRKGKTAVIHPTGTGKDLLHLNGLKTVHPAICLDFIS